jgi:riboflavin synthase
MKYGWMASQQEICGGRSAFLVFLQKQEIDMFTGIIEATGIVKEVISSGKNISFWITSELSSELKVDQSLSHDGVCLTVEEILGDTYKVTAVNETLIKTNIGQLIVGSKVNLERSLRFEGRIDGHIVQGHVDTTAIVKSINDEDGSFRIVFEHEANEGFITVEKGSICVNGVSLTVVNSKASGFEVAIIPYTWSHTNLGLLKPGNIVNIEFDILGKYASRYMQLYSATRIS